MKTRAAILVDQKHPLIIDEIEIPQLKNGQVLVKMKAAGICRSQLNEIDGLKGEDKFLPHLLGHEGSGVVEEIGPKVSKVKKGDRIVVSWIKGSGLEVSSTQYVVNGRTINAGAVTTFGEYMVVSENRVTTIPTGIPFDQAALIGCAIATGGGIVRRTLGLDAHQGRGDRGPTKSIAVFGAGGVGSAAILVANMLGCDPIIAIDIRDEALEFAKKLGATHTIHARGDVFNEVYAITQYLQYALEATGVKSAMETAYACVAKNGTLAIAGNLKKGETISIDPFDLITGKRLTGTWGGETKPDEDFPYYARMIEGKKLNASALITRRVPLERINDAFEAMRQGQSLGRMIVEF